jgi:hypothetical protein
LECSEFRNDFLEESLTSPLSTAYSQCLATLNAVSKRRTDGLKICHSNFQFHSKTPVHYLRLQIPKIRTDKVDGVISWDPDATEAEKEDIINAAKMATENYPSFFPGEVSEDGTA